MGRTGLKAWTWATLASMAFSLTPSIGRAQAGAAQTSVQASPQTSPEPGADVAAQPDAKDAGAAPKRWVLQVQSTLVDQGTFRFRSPYAGPNSLNPGNRSRETFDASLFGGLRLWRGAEAWIEPEIDQGFGLSDTLGVAGFPSGEAYKVGQVTPYIRLQRLFLRQTLDLGGAAQKIDPDQMVMGGEHAANRLVFTAGKLSVGDVFDTNKYAHDPRGDFLNWSIIDGGSFDYAADAWGYTYGLAGEWYQGPWVARLGLFDLSKVPNGERPDDHFTQFETDIEGERDYDLFGQAGKLKLTGFVNRARMGDFADAVRLAEATGQTPSTSLVARYRSHAGISVNLEQQVSRTVGLFLRGGYADGHQQIYEFADIDRTLSGGLSIGGARWGRGDDVVGLAGVFNEVSRAYKDYLNAGGLGVLVGDGRLPHPGGERILETYYSARLAGSAKVTLDYQYVQNPAYNTDRGPVSILGLRLHLQTDDLAP